MHRSFKVLIFAAAVIPAACSGVAATPSATSTPAATPTFGATVAPTRGLTLVPIDAGLAPGTYLSRFDPSFSFTVVRGAFNNDEPTVVNYKYGVGTDGPAAELFMVRITTADPASLGSAIAKLPGVSIVAAPKAVKVGGRDAIQMDVASGASDLQLKSVGADLGFPPTSTIRLILVTVGDKRVIIGYLHHVVTANDGFGDLQGDSKAGFPEAITIFQPFVDSIAWQ